MGGHIYVLVNDAMPGLIKVGKTTLAPEDRAAALSSATGVPSAFRLHRTYSVRDCDEAEKFAHRILQGSVGRPNHSREFFNGPAETICRILDDALATHADNSALLSSEFEEAVRRLSNKEFTVACIEFESAISRYINGSNLSAVFDPEVKRMLGAYVACCIAVKRDPRFAHLISDVHAKGEIMSHAIEVMKAWNEDPAMIVMAFVRELS